MQTVSLIQCAIIVNQYLMYYHCSLLFSVLSLFISIQCTITVHQYLFNVLSLFISTLNCYMYIIIRNFASPSSLNPTGSQPGPHRITARATQDHSLGPRESQPETHKIIYNLGPQDFIIQIKLCQMHLFNINIYFHIQTP